MDSTQQMSLHNLKSVSHTVRFQQDVVLQTATACLMHRIPDLTLVADTRIVDRHLQDCWYLRYAAVQSTYYASLAKMTQTRKCTWAFSNTASVSW